jgi:hypothetical protein
MMKAFMGYHNEAQKAIAQGQNWNKVREAKQTSKGKYMLRLRCHFHSSETEANRSVMDWRIFSVHDEGVYGLPQRGPKGHCSGSELEQGP